MLRQTLIVPTILLLTSSAYAGLTGLGFGIHGGLISGYDNRGLEGSIADTIPEFSLAGEMTNIGAHVNVATLRIIEFDFSLDYLWKRQEVITGVDIVYSDFSLTGTVRKSFAIGVLKPYIGMGGGLHRMVYTIKVDNGGFIPLPEDENKIGYHFKAGTDLSIPLFPFTPFAEWRYSTIRTSGKSTSYSSMLVGLTLDLP